MSALANRLVKEQIAAGGVVTVIDNGSSMEQLCEDIEKAKQEHIARIMSDGCKRNDGPVATPKAEPYYRQFDKRKF